MAVIDNLKVSREAMQEAISNFETRKMAMENACLKISNEVRELDSTWHGQASETFKAQFDEMYTKLKQNEPAMAEIISDLKKAVDLYEAAEKEAESLINSLDEGRVYASFL